MNYVFFFSGKDEVGGYGEDYFRLAATKRTLNNNKIILVFHWTFFSMVGNYLVNLLVFNGKLSLYYNFCVNRKVKTFYVA